MDTHILVPIKLWEAHPKSDYEYSPMLERVVEFIDECLKVDLSEEGIKEKAAFHYPSCNDFSDEGIDVAYDKGGYNGYQQLRKDLLK